MVLGRPKPNERQFERTPPVLLSATAIGLWAVRELMRPPTSRELTPLFEMNSTAVGRVMSSGVRFPVKGVKLVPVSVVPHSALLSATKKRAWARLSNTTDKGVAP